MLTKKKWALFSLLTLCGVEFIITVAEDAFYIPMQEHFHLTNGQIGNAMSVNSFVTTVGFFCLFILPINYRVHTPCHSHSLRQDYWAFIDVNAGVWGILFVWARFGVTCA